METVWIFKLDGTLQCGQGQEVTLADAKAEVEKVGPKVITCEKRQACKLFPSVCGLPTGQANALEISVQDWEEFKRGIVGTLGYEVWSCPDVRLMEDALPWPWVARSKGVTEPALCRDLIGLTLRHYKTGDGLTKDYLVDRVNIEVDEKARIVQVWFG